MVIDSTDRERLAVTREELYRMLQHEDLSKASLLVYANKQVSSGDVQAMFIIKLKKGGHAPPRILSIFFNNRVAPTARGKAIK